MVFLNKNSCDLLKLHLLATVYFGKASAVNKKILKILYKNKININIKFNLIKIDEYILPPNWVNIYWKDYYHKKQFLIFFSQNWFI